MWNDNIIQFVFLLLWVRLMIFSYIESPLKLLFLWITCSYILPIFPLGYWPFPLNFSCCLYISDNCPLYILKIYCFLLCGWFLIFLFYVIEPDYFKLLVDSEWQLVSTPTSNIYMAVFMSCILWFFTFRSPAILKFILVYGVRCRFNCIIFEMPQH